MSILNRTVWDILGANTQPPVFHVCRITFQKLSVLLVPTGAPELLTSRNTPTYQYLAAAGLQRAPKSPCKLLMLNLSLCTQLNLKFVIIITIWIPDDNVNPVIWNKLWKHKCVKIKLGIFFIFCKKNFLRQ